MFIRLVIMGLPIMTNAWAKLKRLDNRPVSFPYFFTSKRIGVEMSEKKIDKPMDEQEFEKIMKKLDDPEEVQKAFGKLLDIAKKEKEKAKK